MSDIVNPSCETPADQPRHVALFTLRPPATLFFTDTARNGLTVKYVRHVHPEPSSKATPNEPAAKAAATA